MKPFSIDLPLPPGPLLVEASAGTGKTWSIARLVARLLAEDGPDGAPPPRLEQVLVVTFTEAAAAELRDRVRRVLVEAANFLETRQAAPAHAAPDPALAHLGRGEPALLRRRAARLRRAVRDFELAPISTIHGFCHQVLRTSSFEADAPFQAELLQDPARTLERLADDWLANQVQPADDGAYRWLLQEARLSGPRLREIARLALAWPDAELRPAPGDWAQRLRARAARAAALAADWAAAEAELLAQLTKPNLLNGTSYPAKKLPGAVQATAAWLASGAAGARPKPDLGAAALAQKTRKGQAPPDHPLFSALDALEEGCPLPDRDAPVSEFAHWVRARFPEELDRAGALTFQDLLEQVRRAITPTPEGLPSPLTARLRQRFRVALLDEFQDTDGVQWEIFRTVFLEDPTSRLVLVGDPKQAIYAFRGADVGVYAEARRAVPLDRQRTMTRNFRSDQAVVQALDALYRGANPFLTPEITWTSVAAAHGDRLVGPPEASHPLRLRWLAPSGGEPTLSLSEVEAELPDQVARDVLATLHAGLARQEGGEVLRLRPADLAVLTATNAQARLVHRALLRQGVPAVVASSGSVLESEEASWILAWLEALSPDAGEAPLRRVAASPLGGKSAAELLSARLGQEPAAAAWLRLRAATRAQAELLSSRGLPSAFAELLRSGEPTVEERLAQLPTGERHLTNCRHLIELLEAAAGTRRRTAAEHAAWLQAAASGEVEAGEETELRLESDADTVQVLTMHKSKGLEYGVVFLPYLADGRVFRGGNGPPTPVSWHGPAPRRQRVLALGGLEALDEAQQARVEREAQEEKARLLYVALTRARHQVVVYAAPIQGSRRPARGLPSPSFGRSALGALLLGAEGPDRLDRAEEVFTGLTQAPGDALLESLGASAPGALAREVIEAAPRLPPPAWDPLEREWLPIEPFPRATLDTLWRRESFSGLLREKKAQIQEVRPEIGPTRDDDDDEDAGGAALPLAPADPLAEFPRGKEAGSWVHGVLERLDFPTGLPKDGAPLEEAVAGEGRRWGFHDPEAAAVLTRALPLWLKTPLGPLAQDRCLADLPGRDRLAELSFDLPIGPGDRWRGHRPLAGDTLGALLGERREAFPELNPYFDHLPQLGLRPLAGYLTGSIDLIFRIPVDGRWRWFIADYKTNRLEAAPGRADAASGYHLSALAEEMAKKHYFIQSLFYQVALHRYLEHRCRDYDPHRDLGGGLYLFLRGMRGVDTPRRADGGTDGVFYDLPPVRQVLALSDALARVEGGP